MRTVVGFPATRGGVELVGKRGPPNPSPTTSLLTYLRSEKRAEHWPFNTRAEVNLKALCTQTTGAASVAVFIGGLWPDFADKKMVGLADSNKRHGFMKTVENQALEPIYGRLTDYLERRWQKHGFE
jgi:hypothetical protein